MKRTTHALLWLAVSFAYYPHVLTAADQPQWGQRGSRNMVSEETGLTDGFDPGTRNFETGGIDFDAGGPVKWVARIGD